MKQRQKRVKRGGGKARKTIKKNKTNSKEEKETDKSSRHNPIASTIHSPATDFQKPPTSRLIPKRRFFFSSFETSARLGLGPDEAIDA
jgi:hypothetical protein